MGTSFQPSTRAHVVDQRCGSHRIRLCESHRTTGWRWSSSDRECSSRTRHDASRRRPLPQRKRSRNKASTQYPTYSRRSTPHLGPARRLRTTKQHDDGIVRRLFATRLLGRAAGGRDYWFTRTGSRRKLSPPPNRCVCRQTPCGKRPQCRPRPGAIDSFFFFFPSRRSKRSD